MRSDQADKAYLWDMLDSALAIQDFVRGQTPHDYLTNRMLRGAVERNIEIIGEAARRVSDRMKAAHPEIPWQAIIGQRNILAHEYGEVRHEIVWHVASDRIPELISAIQAILPREKQDD
jgi:uncharacterized protein with HEPN domain